MHLLLLAENHAGAGMIAMTFAGVVPGQTLVLVLLVCVLGGMPKSNGCQWCCQRQQLAAVAAQNATFDWPMLPS